MMAQLGPMATMAVAAARSRAAVLACSAERMVAEENGVQGGLAQTKCGRVTPVGQSRTHRREQAAPVADVDVHAVGGGVDALVRGASDGVDVHAEHNIEARAV